MGVQLLVLKLIFDLHFCHLFWSENKAISWTCLLVQLKISYTQYPIISNKLLNGYHVNDFLNLSVKCNFRLLGASSVTRTGEPERYLICQFYRFVSSIRSLYLQSLSYVPMCQGFCRITIRILGNWIKLSFQHP